MRLVAFMRKIAANTWLFMAVDPKARRFSLTWDGGYLTATVGLLEALYGADFADKVGAGKSKTISVKGHTRQRRIGGPTTSIASFDYNVIDYPRRVSGGAAGGQPIRIETGGAWWTARLGGSVQDFKAFLAGTGKPDKTFQFMTEKGGLYSSAS
ncbi:MAG: hypothetical protein RLZZ11_501 [Cyanobacteriota bacterium]